MSIASSSSSTRSVLSLLISSAVLVWATTADGFTVGSHYDLTFNAFVDAPDGTPGMEGHFKRDLIFDGITDEVPLNFPVPPDLAGKDLTTIEIMQQIDGAMMTDVLIEAADGGPLVANPFSAGSFGRVTFSLTKMIWQDGNQGPAQLMTPAVYAYDASDSQRQLAADIHVSGDGQMLSPWRVLVTVPGDEFGSDTETVQVSFAVVPEPSAALGLLCGVPLLVFLQRRLKS